MILKYFVAHASSEKLLLAINGYFKLLLRMPGTFRICGHVINLLLKEFKYNIPVTVVDFCVFTPLPLLH